MKCKNCQTFYVRDPCPNCGHYSTDQDTKTQSTAGQETERVKPSKIHERETSGGRQVLLQEKKDDEERLVRPSQRFKQEQENDEDLPSFQRFENQDETGEKLVSPSERLKKDQMDNEDLPSFKRFDRDTKQNWQKPATSVQKKVEKEEEDDIPSFKRYQQTDEIEISRISKLNQPENQDKLKNDKAYRNQVKETLEEVMGLLEKLIDED